LSTTHLPWSVKGVEPEAREAAKIAARRANLTLGAWLSRSIRAAAAQELGSDRPPDAAAAQLPAPPNKVLLEAIQSQTEAMRQAVASAADSALQPIASKIEAIAGRIEDFGDVGARLAETEKKAARTALAIAPLERAVTRLAQTAASVSPAPPRPGLFRRLLGGAR
jgi:localization factor PodJL